MADKLVLQNLSDGDLSAELQNAQSAYMSVRLDHATQGIANPNEIKDARRKIAKIKTEIRRRELAAMTPEQLANRSRIRFRRR